MRYCLLLLLMAAHPAIAYSIKPYVGAGFGYTWTQAHFNDQIREFGEREVPSHSDVTNSGMPFSLYGGFRFHPHYGFEYGYVDYGSIQFKKTLTVRDISDNSLIRTHTRDATIGASGFLFSHVLFLPVTSSLGLQLKAGVLFGNAAYSDTETIVTQPNDDLPDGSTLVLNNASSDGFAKMQWGLAALYRASERTFWRLQVNQLEFEHEDERESFSQWMTQLSIEWVL